MCLSNIRRTVQVSKEDAEIAYKGFDSEMYGLLCIHPVDSKWPSESTSFEVGIVYSARRILLTVFNVTLLSKLMGIGSMRGIVNDTESTIKQKNYMSGFHSFETAKQVIDYYNPKHSWGIRVWEVRLWGEVIYGSQDGIPTIVGQYMELVEEIDPEEYHEG